MPRRSRIAEQTFAELVERVLRFRMPRRGKRDFKRFLREAPDFEQLDLTRRDETARRVEP